MCSRAWGFCEFHKWARLSDRFRIFSPERTACDCFAYPKIVDESVAFEGLRNYLDRNTANLELLMQHAKFTDTVDVIGPVVKARLA